MMTQWVRSVLKIMVCPHYIILHKKKLDWIILAPDILIMRHGQSHSQITQTMQREAM